VLPLPPAPPTYTPTSVQISTQTTCYGPDQMAEGKTDAQERWSWKFLSNPFVVPVLERFSMELDAFA
jgi:hypothetical protein